MQKLHEAGFEALWAGGCVRDELLGLIPHDYDVATNATPDEVRSCFGRRRTLAIGEAFGVVTVVGSRDEGQIEVATFRCDAGYSDGRRPDSVSFSTAQEDALRRDFTINGMFYDPLTQRSDRLCGWPAGPGGGHRAGDRRSAGAVCRRQAPHVARCPPGVEIRLSRSIPHTLAAVQDQAATITIVSAERIADGNAEDPGASAPRARRAAAP